jgi:hypothetical protein
MTRRNAVSSAAISGLNIQWPWSERILKKEKTIETRYYPLPRKYIGIRLALIETPGKSGKFKARIVGFVTFGEPFKYKSRTHFDSEYSKHLVKSDDKALGWSSKKPKWGWPVIETEVLREPVLAPVPRGIVFCTQCKVPTQPSL